METLNETQELIETDVTSWSYLALDDAKYPIEIVDKGVWRVVTPTQIITMRVENRD